MGHHPPQRGDRPARNAPPTRGAIGAIAAPVTHRSASSRRCSSWPHWRCWPDAPRTPNGCQGSPHRDPTQSDIRLVRAETCDQLVAAAVLASRRSATGWSASRGTAGRRRVRRGSDRVRGRRRAGALPGASTPATTMAPPPSLPGGRTDGRRPAAAPDQSTTPKGDDTSGAPVTPAPTTRSRASTRGDMAKTDGRHLVTLTGDGVLLRSCSTTPHRRRAAGPQRDGLPQPSHVRDDHRQLLLLATRWSPCRFDGTDGACRSPTSPGGPERPEHASGHGAEGGRRAGRHPDDRSTIPHRRPTVARHTDRTDAHADARAAPEPMPPETTVPEPTTTTTTTTTATSTSTTDDRHRSGGSAAAPVDAPARRRRRHRPPARRVPGTSCRPRWVEPTGDVAMRPRPGEYVLTVGVPSATLPP